MRIDLKPYTRPEEYAGIYDHNFHQINAIGEDEAFAAFVARLSRFSGVAPEIVLADLKDHLMSKHEYKPSALKPDRRNELIFPYFLASMATGLFAPRQGRADVIVDVWYPEAVKMFYTRELKEGLSGEYKCLWEDFGRLRWISPGDLLRSLVPFMQALHDGRRIMALHGLDLRQYVYFFFKKVLLGSAIKKDIAPKLIISGNDNCFPFLVAKAAGAELMLIQNGRRALNGLFAFKYVDHYVGWGDIFLMLRTGLAGHVFKHMYNLGSIRLYDHYRKYKEHGKVLYDIAWISTWERSTSGAYGADRRHWINYESDCAAVKVLNGFAATCGLKIAFQCAGRDDSSAQDLAAAGLKMDNITYMANDRQGCYATVFQSKVVLTPNSSVGVEAMGVGKKVGFVNLSGNEYMNSYFKDLDIEFNRSTKITFEQFMDKILKQEVDFKDHFVQDHDYVPELLKIIKKIVVTERVGHA